MKKYFTLFVLWFTVLYGSSQNQTITLTFSGEDSVTHNSVPLESAVIYNITADCDTTIYGPAPSLLLIFPSGIREQLFPGTEPVVILPPVPNPFNGMTSVMIRLNQAGVVKLSLYDPLGKVVADHQADLKTGLNKFEIETSVNAFLLLNVSDGHFSRAVKLINNSNGPGENRITYIGTSQDNLKSGSSINGFTFRKGDQLSYRALTNGYYDKILFDSPTRDTSYNFKLTMIPTAPVVISANVTNITAKTATGGGDVTSEGGDSVTTRGFCWSTAPDPTIADSHTVDGTGMGTFVSYLTGLNPYTAYHGRAYAINNIGTSYGDDVEFTTLQTVPTVVTSRIFNITPTTATGSGEVKSDGGAAVTARGFCWSTSPDPTLTDPHTVDGSGTGLFESNITGLIPDFTYYGRAYAINSEGTSYGENISFYAPGDGFYIKGTATAYSEFNENALMNITRNEVIQTEDPNLLELYIPVKAGSGGFNIVQVLGTTMTTFGPGPDFATIYNGSQDEPKVPFQRGSFIEDTARFLVPSDAMYHVAIYLITQKAVVVPVHWGMIGSATYLGWAGGSVPMTESPFDLNSMAWTIDSLELWGGEWKFRYSDGWKVELDTTVYIAPGIKGVKVNANFGGAVDALVPGGANIVNNDPGLYICTMEYNLGSGYQATLIKTGPLPPTDWTGVVCDAVGTGISLDNPTAAPDTSSWHWGNQMLGDNGGIPTVSDLVYTWTWTNIIIEAYEGFKVRTLNGLPSPLNGRYFDGGYYDLNIAASAPEIIDGGGGNLMATVKGSYTITLNVDADNADHIEIIIGKN